MTSKKTFMPLAWALAMRRLQVVVGAEVRVDLGEVVYSEGGVTFFEALAPVPLDHVPDKQRDLVLAEGGVTHVER